MRPEVANINYLLGTISKASGSPDEAVSFSRQAVKVIDGLLAEPGGEKILQRVDMNSIYKDSQQINAASAKH